MRRAFVYAIAIIICAIILSFITPSSAPFNLIAGFMIGIALPLLDLIAANNRFWRLAYYSIRYANKTIRVSASYMFRIKIDNTYLLIKGHRWPHYQPVGGVYKMSPSAKYVMNKLTSLDDNLVPIDDASLNDLRIRIPARKLIAFARWFESGSERETSPWREFYEELVGPGILPADNFPFISEDFIRRYIPAIRFSSWAQSMEFFIADIYELLPMPEQLQSLRMLRDTHPSEVIWATENQIRHRGAIPGEKLTVEISETAAWIL